MLVPVSSQYFQVPGEAYLALVGDGVTVDPGRAVGSGVGSVAIVTSMVPGDTPSTVTSLGGTTCGSIA